MVLREHKKNINDQRKIDAQLKNTQQSAGPQIYNRVDQNMAGLDAKVKSIIKETVKSQSIKKEGIMFDASLLECDLTTKEFNSQSFPQSSASTKRPRQPETIDLRSPVYQRNTKKHEFRNEGGKQYHSSSQTKGY